MSPERGRGEVGGGGNKRHLQSVRNSCPPDVVTTGRARRLGWGGGGGEGGLSSTLTTCPSCLDSIIGMCLYYCRNT